MPGFLAYLAGTSLDEAESNRKEIFLSTVFFVLGFSLVFSLLGVLLNTALESVAYDLQTWLSRIGGAFIIFFGLYLTGLLKIPWLEKEHKLKVTKKFKSRYLTSFIFGFAFAVGWSPCVGAVLGSILALSSAQPGVAFTLLFTYTMGLGLPFLVVGLFTSKSVELINRFAHLLESVRKLFGWFLILIGVLVFAGYLSRVASVEFLTGWFMP